MKKPEISNSNITDFEDLLREEYGERGTTEREDFERRSLAFRMGVMLKQARREEKLTQMELARRTGTKKSYISRIERGKSDIQISTYHRLVQDGLGRELVISIR